MKPSAQFNLLLMLTALRSAGLVLLAWRMQRASRAHQQALHADGHRIAVEASGSQVEAALASGTQQLFTVLLRDVSQRKVAAEEMRLIRARYGSALELSPDALWVVENGLVVRVSPAAVRLAGGTLASDLLGREMAEPVPGAGGVSNPADDAASAPLAQDATPVTQRIHPADRARIDTALARSAASLSPCQLEWRYQHPVQGERWFEGSCMPRREADGALTWHVFVMDVTERKRAGEAAAEHRSRPLRIFGTVHDVTEQRQATLTLERSREELRRLSAKRHAAREEARRHFSHELHDEPGQRLQAIRKDIGAMLSVGEVPPETAATAVYRIAQEALTDDRPGLVPGGLDKCDSNGLVGMQERARIPGGDVALSNLPTGGCRLEARLPLDRVDSQLGRWEEEQ